MNILVTGATGNFGGYALKVLQGLVPEDNLYGLARTEVIIKSSLSLLTD